MEYRVRLGQTLDDTNLMVDGVFATVCFAGTWTCGPNWNIAAGRAQHLGTYDTISNTNNIFTFTPTLPDTIRYQINFDTLNAAAGATVRVFVGNDSASSLEVSGNGSHQLIAKHLTPASQIFHMGADGNIDVDNVTVFNFKWNDPLETQPSLDKTSIKIGDGFLLRGLISTFGGTLKFTGDGYRFLKDIFDNLPVTAYCSRVDIYIERNNGGVWEKHFEGYVYFSDCEFDFKKKHVIVNKVTSLTENATTKLLDRQVTHDPRKGWLFDNTATFRSMSFRECAGPLWNDQEAVFKIGGTLRATLNNASEMELALESDFFDVTHEWYSITNDDLIQNAGVPPSDDDHSIFITFNEYITNLNAIFNMGIIDRFDDVIPTLVFEQKQVLGGSSVGFTLENVDAAPISYSDPNIYSSVEIGWSDSFSTTNGVEFSSWDKFTFTSDVLCAQKNLPLVSDWIADDQAIDDIRCIPETTDRIIFIGGRDTGGIPEARCAGIDANYNLCVETIDMMNDHIWSLQSSFRNDNDNAGNATKANNPFVKEVEFRTKLTVAQLDEIRNNPNFLINFTAPEQNLPAGTSGYIIDFECDNITMVARFKLLI